ncbi:hypothetical protein F9K33_08370 [bacterium]|nr:MAG: hypothetical protein F9K33_08370 [bacterium]
METQNYANHRRIVPLFHFVAFALLLALGIGSIVHFGNAYSRGHGRLDAAMMVLTFIILTFIYFYARLFALRAQDRAIRAEENLRHFVLTGKLMDPRLTLQQVIGLRFAKDEEFIELSKRAAAENLSQDDIKKSIQNWRGDHHRV